MKVAFWSSVHGQSCTTANLLAITLMTVMEYKRKSLILQNHFQLNNLEKPLIGKIEEGLYENIGIDALVRAVKSAPLDDDTFYNSSISFLNKQLSLIPGTTKCNRLIYENDMVHSIKQILEAADQYNDMVFVDTNSGDSDITQMILKEADIIVVNLSQNKSMIEEYIKNYKYPQEKIIYLIGSYNQNSRYNQKNLIRMYDPFNKHNLSVIPYSTEFLDHLSEGTLIDFMVKNIEAQKEDSTFYFIQQVKHATDMIIKKTGLLE